MRERKEKVTLGMLDRRFDDLPVFIDKLAGAIHLEFIGMRAEMATKDDLRALMERVEGLEKEMRGMHQNFDAIFIELREIRREIKEIDTRAEVLDIQIRLSKLEKKFGLKTKP